MLIIDVLVSSNNMDKCPAHRASLDQIPVDMLSPPFQINAFCPGEHHRADLCAVVGLQEGGDAPVGNSIPDLDTSILGSTAEMLTAVLV